MHDASQVSPVHVSMSVGATRVVTGDHGPSRLGAVDTPNPHQCVAGLPHVNPHPYIVPYR